MTPRAFSALFRRRWQEARSRFDELPPLQWAFGDHPHFQEDRGFAVAFLGENGCEIRFARKILDQHPSRIEAVLLHELGHVIDYIVQPLTFPLTVERRADAIAEVVWAVKIRYDDGDVQNTQEGVYPRPWRLGL